MSDLDRPEESPPEPEAVREMGRKLAQHPDPALQAIGPVMLAEMAAEPFILKRSIAEAYGELPARIRQLKKIQVAGVPKISRAAARPPVFFFTRY